MVNTLEPSCGFVKSFDIEERVLPFVWRSLSIFVYDANPDGRNFDIIQCPKNCRIKREFVKKPSSLEDARIILDLVRKAHQQHLTVGFDAFERERYILVDEECKEGDYYTNFGEDIVKVNSSLYYYD